jgi:hypothetical protein
MDRRFLLAVLPVVLWAALPGRSAMAGHFFGRKNKPTPAERVPELIQTLKIDGDEHKRSSAAEELRQYDASQFPDMVPALIEALLGDKKPAVRAEAAQTLGKLRPVTPAAGAALEQALAKDGSMRVRLQARSSLLQYRWSGYAPKGKEEAAAPPPQSKEPPLAVAPPSQSKEPPLAPPAAAPAPPAQPRLRPVPATPTGAKSAARPLPAGPPALPPQSVEPPTAGKAASPADEQGPDLTPP